MPSKLKQFIPILVFIGVILGAQNWWRIALWLNPIDNRNLSPGDVVLYSTSWCPYCARTRAFLQQADIPYTEYDIEKSDRAMREYEQLNGHGVPVIKIGDKVIQGYDPSMIRKALDTLSRQKAQPSTTDQTALKQHTLARSPQAVPLASHIAV